jgi:hypothetical protein
VLTTRRTSTGKRLFRGLIGVLGQCAGLLVFSFAVGLVAGLVDAGAIPTRRSAGVAWDQILAEVMLRAVLPACLAGGAFVALLGTAAVGDRKTRHAAVDAVASTGLVVVVSVLLDSAWPRHRITFMPFLFTVFVVTPLASVLGTFIASSWRVAEMAGPQTNRKVPGTVDVVGREFRYLSDDGRDLFDELFRKVMHHATIPRAKSGGAIAENCKLRLPDDRLFHALSYKGDIDGWRSDIEEAAQALGLEVARIVGNDVILLPDGSSIPLRDCRIEFSGPPRKKVVDGVSSGDTHGSE